MKPVVCKRWHGDDYGAFVVLGVMVLILVGFSVAVLDSLLGYSAMKQQVKALRERVQHIEDTIWPRPDLIWPRSDLMGLSVDADGTLSYAIGPLAWDLADMKTIEWVIERDLMIKKTKKR